MQTKEVRWTSPVVVDIPETPIEPRPYRCPPEGEPPPEEEIENIMMQNTVDPDPELMSQLLSAEEEITDDRFCCHRSIPIDQLTAAEDSDPEITSLIGRGEHLQGLSDASTEASESDTKGNLKDPTLKKYSTKRSR